MRLERWALIAEVASALAVVVTLAILIMGIRENTRSTQAATYQSLMTEFNRLDSIALEDLNRYAAFLNVDSGDLDAELVQAEITTRMASRSFEAAYFSYRNGTLDASQWERFHRNVCGLRGIRGPEFWARIGRILTEEFVSHLEESCPPGGDD